MASQKYYSEETQTLIGTKRKELVDVESGESIWVDQITKRVYGSKSFWKVYLMDFLTVLGIIDSKQLDVFIYIAENTNQATNVFLGSYTKIEKDVGVCRQTVAKIMAKLQDKGFIKKIQSGAWLVNPNILMRGGEHKRQILLSYYKSDEPVDEMTFQRVKRGAIDGSKTREERSDIGEVISSAVPLLRDGEVFDGATEDGDGEDHIEGVGTEV